MSVDKCGRLRSANTEKCIGSKKTEQNGMYGWHSEPTARKMGGDKEQFDSLRQAVAVGAVTGSLYRASKPHGSQYLASLKLPRLRSTGPGSC